MAPKLLHHYAIHEKIIVKPKFYAKTQQDSVP